MKLYKENGAKIFNPTTGRYVKKSGTIGRRLERMTDSEYNSLGAGAGAGAGASDEEEGGVKSFSQDKTKILNPSSNRFVAVSGATGRKLLRMSNQEYTALKGGAPVPKKSVKKSSSGRSESLKKVIRDQQAGTIVRGVQRADQLRDTPPRSTIKNVARSLVSDEARDGVDEDVRENSPPRSTIRNVARSLVSDEARDRVNEAVRENPEVAIIPPLHNIRDVARAIVSDDRGLAEALARSLAEEQVRPEPPALERQVTDVDQYRPPGLQRQDTDPSSYRTPELQRQITEESRYRPPGLQRQLTDPTMPAQEPSENYLEILLTVTDAIDDIIEEIEEEAKKEPKKVKMTYQELEDMIFDQIEEAIRVERKRELLRVIREELKEQEFIEDVFNDPEYDLYALEPVDDDTPEYIDAWKDAVNRLNELAEEEFGVEEAKEGAKGEEEKGEAKEHIFDDLTTEMGMDNMGEEQLRERTIDDSIAALRQNLMNIEFLDSGRGPYTSSSNVPDPHLDAFQHIAESKK